MMKRRIALLAAALLLAFPGCGRPDAPPPNGGEEDALAQRSLAYLDQFQRGETAPFYRDVTAELAAQLPEEAFAAQWSAVLLQAGARESVGEPVCETRDGHTAVSVTAVHALRRLASVFVYDAQGKVAGISNQFLPLVTEPRSAEGWEEVPLQVGAGENKLSGLLTLPKGVEKPPVAVLIQGSGPSNMDEKIGAGGNRPFADLAHGLAERGVASIRYDKRTYAYPADCAGRGIACEYLDDAAAAIALLAADPRVDGNRIFLIGHSEGGMLAPKIAQDNPAVRGVVSMAGTLRRLEDLMLDQSRRMAAQDETMTEEQKQARLQQIEAEIQRIKSLDPADNSSVILGVDAAYWNSLNAVDVPAIVRELAVPMLILQGEEDFQVLADVDYPLWQEALAGRDNAALRLYPGLNHLFARGGAKERIDAAVYDKPAPMDPQVIADIADWIGSVG